MSEGGGNGGGGKGILFSPGDFIEELSGQVAVGNFGKCVT